MTCFANSRFVNLFSESLIRECCVCAILALASESITKVTPNLTIDQIWLSNRNLRAFGGAGRFATNLSKDTPMEKQVIEYGGQPVGIVIPEKDALKFIAVKYHVMDFDSRIFRSPREVRDAIRQHLTPLQFRHP